MAKPTRRRPFKPLDDREYEERDVVGALKGELREAWRTLKRLARGLGPQRTYASNRSVMFARAYVYAFVRPRKSFLEVCFFADRPLRGAGLKVRARSPRKHAHTFKLERADQVAALEPRLAKAYLLARTQKKSAEEIAD